MSFFVVVGIVACGMILFALRPGPWVFNITEESLRMPPGGRQWREWWSEAELERRTRPWGDHAKDLVDWTAVNAHVARIRPAFTRHVKAAEQTGARDRLSTATT